MGISMLNICPVNILENWKYQNKQEMFVKHQSPPQSCNIEKGYTIDYQNHQILSSLVSTVDKPIYIQNW
jgi:hypothetical protein